MVASWPDMTTEDWASLSTHDWAVLESGTIDYLEYVLDDTNYTMEIYSEHDDSTHTYKRSSDNTTIMQPFINDISCVCAYHSPRGNHPSGTFEGAILIAPDCVLWPEHLGWTSMDHMYFVSPSNETVDVGPINRDNWYNVPPPNACDSHHTDFTVALVTNPTQAIPPAIICENIDQLVIPRYELRFNQCRKCGIGRITSVGDMIYSEYLPDHPGKSFVVIGGDSGYPVFIVPFGTTRAYLVNMWTFVGSGSNIPLNIDKINAAMEIVGSQYHLTTHTVVPAAT